MRPKLAILLAIIVLVPVVTTAWLGYRMARDEESVMRLRLQELLLAPLREIDRQVIRLRDDRQRQFLALARTISERSRRWLDAVAAQQVPAQQVPAQQVSAQQVSAQQVPNSPQGMALDLPVRPLANNAPLQRAHQQRSFVPQQGQYAQQTQQALRPPQQQRSFVPQQQADVPEQQRPIPSMPHSLRDELLTFERQQPTVRQMFLVSPAGDLLHPNPKEPASRREREFLARTERLWAEGQRFWQPTDSNASKEPTRFHGWHVWYYGRGMHLIFWHRLTTGAVVGIELDRMRLIADVIGILPDTGSAAASTGGLMVLRDSRNGKLYQWGHYAPGETEAPRAYLHLSPPFSSWKLEYYAAEVTELLGSGMRRSLLLGLIALAIALTWMVVFFYREYTRDIREASQRVNFVNQVSHELKTPLTNIRMYAELLDDELLDEDQRANRYLGVIVNESQRLSRLIGNVLSFARHQRKKLKIRKTRASVDDIVRRVLARFKPSLDSRSIAVEAKLAATKQVFVDGDALEQVLGNLVSNVEKYGSAGGVLLVETRQTDDGSRTTLLVSDRGAGIDEAFHEQIFDPFFRVSDGLSDSGTGTGIGLAIARELARLHGGDLRVLANEERGRTLAGERTGQPLPSDGRGRPLSNERAGHGATFELTLDTTDSTHTEKHGEVEHEGADS